MSTLDKIAIVKTYYSKLDSGSASDGLYEETFAEDVSARMGNNPTINGRENLVAFFKKLGGAIQGTIHTFENAYVVNENLVILEGFVEYKLSSGAIVDKIPVCGHFEVDTDSKLIKNYKVFVNQTPLFVALGFDLTADDSGKVVMKKRM